MCAIALAALGLGAACDGGDGPDPMPSGLGLRWSSTPGIPGNTSRARVGQFQFRPGAVRILREDLAGDTGTDVDGVTVQWASTLNVGELDFPDAAPGRYTRVELGGGDYVLGGTIALGDATVSYVVLDALAMVTLPIDVTVAPGRKAWVHVEIDVGSVVEVVPFETMRTDDQGWLRLESGEPGIETVRAALAAAFRIAP